MHTRAGGAAGIAGLGDDLALLHLVALLDQQRLVVAVGGDVAAGMLDQQKVAEMGHFAAGIDDGAAVGRLHRLALVGLDVDAVVLLAAGRRAVGRQDLAPDRPGEARRWRRGGDAGTLLVGRRAERRGLA